MRRRDFIAGATAWPFFFTSSWAYQIPLDILLDQAENRLNRQRGMQITFVGEHRDLTTDEVNKFGSRWTFRTPTEIKLNGPGGQGAEVRLNSQLFGPGASSGSDDVVTGQAGHLLPPSFMQLVLDSAFRLGQLRPLLKRLKIIRNARCLALFEEKAMQVIGSESPRDRGKGQIWIDQDSFRLARISGAWRGVEYDLRFHQWKGPITHGHFPHKLLLLRQGRWVRRMETEGLRQAVGE